MKIGIFTNNYLPNPYGVTGSIESFRKEFEKKGHTVYIFAPYSRGYADENPNVFRYPSIDINYKISFPLAIPFSRRISKIIEKIEIDIIHSQHPNLLGTAAMKWGRKKKIPLVFTWHTLYDKYAHFAPLIPTSWAAKWAVNNAVSYANKCSQIIVPTRSIAEIIRNWGVANENIEIIPTGIEEEMLQNADGHGIRKKYKIADDEILAVIVTRFTAEKNIEFLFRAMIKALGKNSKLKFLACGDGYLEEKLKEFVTKNSMNERIIFSGFVANDVKKHYYSAGDIFVFASKSETQGMILTEAMHLELPIVAVNATGARDIVRDNETGFLTSENENDFSEAVLKLAGNSNLRKNFGEKAKKIAGEFYTSSICAERMQEVYQKLINKNG